MKLNFPQIKQLTVTTTVVRILEKNPLRKAVLIYNNGTAPVYLGHTDKVTSSTGMPIINQATYSNDHFNPTGEYWCIGTQAGGDDIRIEEDFSEGA